MSAIIDYGVTPPCIRCTDCDAVAPFTLPMSIEQACQVSRAFAAKHAKCWIEKQMRREASQVGTMRPAVRR